MADLIKKIKIKKQDGTFTDYIPIGAEAQNVSTNDGDSVQLKLNKKPYYYNSVADMKADTKLKVGDMVVTLGYYEPNDGGAAEYKIVNIASQTEYQEELNNNLYATLIVDNEVNIKQLGAKGDGLNDDTLAIQNAIDKYNNILIPKGTFMIKSINVNVETTIKGINKNDSILKSIDSVYSENESMIYGEYTGTSGNDRFIIENVTLDGDHKGINGIHISKTNSQIHPGWHVIKNINIKFFNGNGIYLGRGASETDISIVEIYNCGKNGLVIETNDVTCRNVDSHNNEYNGFYINGGYNRFSDCKAWWNGRNYNAEQSDRKYGFFVKTYQNQFVNCVAQENANHGIYVESAKGITFNSCSVDRNGLPLTNWSSDSPETPYASGIYIKDSSQIIYDGVCWDMMKWQWGQTQKYGINMDNSNSIYVNAIINDQEIDYTYSGGYHISLIINGRKVLTNREQTIGAYDLLNNTTIKNYIQPAGEQSRLGYDVYSENSLFQLYSNKDDRLRIATFVKNQNNGWDWTATPVNISNNGDLQFGKSDKKMGFFGATPITKPLIDGKATDLNSTMDVVNKIANALGSLGLIQR